MQSSTNWTCLFVSLIAKAFTTFVTYSVATHFLFLALLTASHARSVQKEEYFFRHPTGHGSTVVFEFHGHVWWQEGNSIAKRVTDSDTNETTPVLSPDGLRVAYVALGDSSDEIFVASLKSGKFTQLTLNGGFNVKVQGWLNATDILYSTNVNSGKRGPLLFVVNTETLRSSVLPLSEAAEGCVLHRDFIYVKNEELIDNSRNYRGGYAQHISKIDYNLIFGERRVGQDRKARSTMLTSNYSGISRRPLCIGDRIFFLSDRDGRFNIWSMEADGANLTQHTFEREFDIRSMTTSDKTDIFFQKAGEIFRFDPADGFAKKIDIHIPPATVVEAKRYVFEPADATNFTVSDDGAHVALILRGKLWTIETRTGNANCVDCHSDRRIKSPVLSSDGMSIFAMHDSSGEYDIFTYSLRDKSTKRVGHQIDDPILDFSLSPNGHDMIVRTIAGTLYHVRAGNGGTTRIDLTSLERPNSIAWSSDGSLATFVTYPADGISRITTFDTLCNSVAYLTSGRYNVSTPIFSRDSREIYYIADNNFRSSIDDTWHPANYWPAYDNRSLIYSVKVSPPQLRHPNNQVPSTSDRATRDLVCLSRIAERGVSRHELLLTRELPVVAGNYERLLLNNDYLHAFSKKAIRDKWGRIVVFDLKRDSRSAPQSAFNDEIYEYSLSASGRSIIARTAKGLFISSMDARGQFGPSFRLNKIAGLEVQINLADERKQMFNELWRMYRDYFFDHTMKGVNWKDEREKYRAFLPRVSNQTELGQIVADMVAELGAGHTSLGIAVSDTKDLQGVARLGAEFDDINYLRVVKLFDGDLDVIEERSPLSQTNPPVDVGDRIVRINGVDVTSKLMLNKILYGQVGKTLTLAVQKTDGKVYESHVVPISSGHETWLRYKSWAKSNSDKVDERSKRTVGYIHLQSAYESDFSEFIRHYHYLHQRDALILDLRGNNGGNIDPWILNFLQRRTWLHITERYIPEPLRYPRQSFAGKVIVLIDGDTYSDGELIAEGVRQLQLGLLIGTRTSGAGKWVNDDKTLIDGSKVRIPESGAYIVGKGKPRWVIEGHGVNPDIHVENDPYLFYLGSDAQLEAAIDHAMGAPKQ